MIQPTPSPLKTRSRYTYIGEARQAIEDEANLTNVYFRKMHRNGVSVIHDNQYAIANEIIDAFQNRSIINTIVVAKTQSGKTGIMCSVIREWLSHSADLIPVENIFIITGLSSCEWKQQTKKRLPINIQPQIFHAPDLKKTFIKALANKKNVLIIIDEIQIACRYDQHLYNIFKQCGLMDIDYLYKNDIKLLKFTATPNGIIYDLHRWGNDISKIIIGKPGDNYTGAIDLLNQGRIKQYADLTNAATDEEGGIYEQIRCDIDTFTEPRYHIVRVCSKEADYTITKFKNYFGDTYHYIKYDMCNRITSAGISSDKVAKLYNNDINTLLVNEPKQHTFIFIKELLRCAKTINHTYIGVMFERHTSQPDDSVIIQGLLGRMTGYTDNGTSICYTNIRCINRYEELWNNEFADLSLKWVSNTTKRKEGILCSKNTFTNPILYKNLLYVQDDTLPPL